METSLAASTLSSFFLLVDLYFTLWPQCFHGRNDTYEKNHILNCGYDIKWSYDPRSYEHFRNWRHLLEDRLWERGWRTPSISFKPPKKRELPRNVNIAAFSSLTFNFFPLIYTWCRVNCICYPSLIWAKATPQWRNIHNLFTTEFIQAP